MELTIVVNSSVILSLTVIGLFLFARIIALVADYDAFLFDLFFLHFNQTRRAGISGALSCLVPACHGASHFASFKQLVPLHKLFFFLRFKQIAFHCVALRVCHCRPRSRLILFASYRFVFLLPCLAACHGTSGRNRATDGLL